MVEIGMIVYINVETISRLNDVDKVATSMEIRNNISVEDMIKKRIAKVYLFMKDQAESAK